MLKDVQAEQVLMHGILRQKIHQLMRILSISQQ